MLGMPARVEDLPAGEMMAIEEELPASYGKNRLVLLPVEPYLLYAYWQLAADPAPSSGDRAVLRFHGASRPFDVDVDLASGKSYVNLWSYGKLYQADLGFRGQDGAFVSLAQSNSVQTPPAHPRPAPARPEPRMARPAPALPEPARPEPPRKVDVPAHLEQKTGRTPGPATRSARAATAQRSLAVRSSRTPKNSTTPSRFTWT